MCVHVYVLSTIPTFVSSHGSGQTVVPAHEVGFMAMTPPSSSVALSTCESKEEEKNETPGTEGFASEWQGKAAGCMSFMDQKAHVVELVCLWQQRAWGPSLFLRVGADGVCSRAPQLSPGTTGHQSPRSQQRSRCKQRSCDSEEATPGHMAAATACVTGGGRPLLPSSEALVTFSDVSGLCVCLCRMKPNGDQRKDEKQM